MSDHTNIYFFNAQEALKTALEQNPVPTDNPDIDGLQVCYYNAEAPLEDTPENCIWVPLENVYNYFVTTKNRFPQNLSFINSNFSEKEQDEITSAFDNIIQTARYERTRLKEIFMEEISKIKPDFNEKPWRVFIPACRETKVMQYVSKNIANAFEELGYDVQYYIQDNAMQSCRDLLPLVHAIHEFKPHITVNINHLVNHFLHSDVFNFVWFQDSMPIFHQDEKIYTRERDTIFGLSQSFVDTLAVMGVKDGLLQPFCIDTNIYKDYGLKKEKKVVFIGSSYYPKIKEIQDDVEFKYIFNEVIKLLEQNIVVKSSDDSEQMNYLIKKYNKDKNYLNAIIGYIYRDYCLEILCNLEDIKYDIEVYGYGWENNPTIKPYYKGILSYGEDISKVYNSATYGFCTGGYVYMQRTLECAASNCIPLVLDVRNMDDDYDYTYDNSLEFFNITELSKILCTNEIVEKDLEKITDDFSYKHFTERMLNIIKEKLQ